MAHFVYKKYPGEITVFKTILLMSYTAVKNAECSSDKTPTQIRALSLFLCQFYVRLPKRSTASDRQQTKSAQIPQTTEEKEKKRGR